MKIDVPSQQCEPYPDRYKGLKASHVCCLSVVARGRSARLSRQREPNGCPDMMLSVSYMDACQSSKDCDRSRLTPFSDRNIPFGAGSSSAGEPSCRERHPNIFRCGAVGLVQQFFHSSQTRQSMARQTCCLSDSARAKFSGTWKVKAGGR